MKDKLGGKIKMKFDGWGAKISSYLIDDGSEDKKSKVIKKCVIKGKRKLENYEKRFRSNSTGE